MIEGRFAVSVPASPSDPAPKEEQGRSVCSTHAFPAGAQALQPLQEQCRGSGVG